MGCIQSQYRGIVGFQVRLLRLAAAVDTEVYRRRESRQRMHENSRHTRRLDHGQGPTTQTLN